MRECQLLALIFYLLCTTFVSAQVQMAQVHESTSTEMAQMDTPEKPIPAPLPEDEKISLNKSFLSDNIQSAVNEAIEDKNAPGGVVVVIRNGETALFEAYGNRALVPAQEPATKDTIYDMASLTKPVATASSIMKLVEQGKLRLSDSIDKFIPEWKNTNEEDANAKLLNQLEKAIDQGKIRLNDNNFVATGEENKELLARATETFQSLLSPDMLHTSFNLLPRDRESITIRHLLTHTSGLPSYYRYYEKYPEKGARKKIVSDIAATELRGPVGGQFVYSDLGFIVLGDIVERVSGMPLDKFSHKYIFEPLQMNDTMFNPPDTLLGRIAPTGWRALDKIAEDGTTQSIIRGQVHDDNAYVQDGLSGHAGLFSTATDLARYCKMMLNGGELDGVRIFSPVTVAAMTSDHARLPGQKIQRGLGWDMVSGYDSPKGDIFTTGYGHTGYTGTSIWVVPEEKLAVIVLTNRVHPNDTGTANPLRAKIANIVAGSLEKSLKE